MISNKIFLRTKTIEKKTDKDKIRGKKVCNP